MQTRGRPKLLAAYLWLALGLFCPAIAGEANFVRAINLNGPSLEIDGRKWEGSDSSRVIIKGDKFENQSVPLKPPTDPARSKMIRSSIWGGRASIEFIELEATEFQLVLYVWEDNHSERFDILVNDAVVTEVHSGNAGTWKRLGPWKTSPVQGKLKITARGGAANLSGVELWSGTGTVPEPLKPEFVSQPSAEQIEFFEKRIRPLLVENCYECHSAGAKKIGGELLLDSRTGVVKGGGTGPVILPGLPEESLLIQAVRQIDPNLTMPPKRKLARDQIELLEQWIKMGAPDPRTEDTVAQAKARSTIDWTSAREFWSFRPLATATPPKVQAESWPRNEIDRFTLARMEAAGVLPVGDASKRVLIRRATFDLTGLPPTISEVEDFLKDESPQAFDRVVDRLLASPAYGERWGRYWLDVVRYADTAGDNSDFPIPQMYRYRDWVIAAFNRDLPYDEFVRQQLAGDLLPAASEAEKYEKVIATGYLANARRFGSRVDDYPQHLTIEDTIDNLGRAFLGMSIGCARCHDHKFDPITAADYYSIYGFFHSSRYPWPGIELDQRQKDFVPLVPAGVAKVALEEHAGEQKRLDEERERLAEEVKKAEGEAKKDLEKKLEQAKSAAETHKKRGPKMETAYAMAEAGKVEDVPIQVRGDPAKPGPIARRKFLTVLGGMELPASEQGSGRLQLANWIASDSNPIAARVMANRIWLYHFGKGLVPTPNDFGKQGKPPTHPELLDHLAAEFLKSGWSVKALHRLIMLSRTYQLSSERPERALAQDQGNELLSSYPRRRLDAEAIRDSLLALAGTLETGSGGPHPFPDPADWKFTQHNPFKAVYDHKRRSVYLMTQRIQRHPFLAIFDGADPSASTATRLTSTTPIQALYLLNEKFVHERAAEFAIRISEQTSEPRGRIDFAFRAALGRPAEDFEIAHAQQFLAGALTRETDAGGANELSALTAFNRVLFRLNEFVYID